MAIACTASPAAGQGQEEPIVTTRHTVAIGARSLRYTARAGRIEACSHGNEQALGHKKNSACSEISELRRRELFSLGRDRACV